MMQKSCVLYCLLISIILLYSCSKKQENTDVFANQYENINKMVLQADSLFVLENNEAADSILQDALQMAEATRNQDIILYTLFYNTALNINPNSTTERLDNYKRFINQGLDYAKLFKRQDYIAYANANLAELYIAKGDLQSALTAGNLAFSTAFSLKNDSCKVVTALQLGKVYEKQKELLLAFKTYSNAHDIANICGNDKLLSKVYHHIANLYSTLNKNEEAKDYYFKSLELNKELNNTDGEIKDYIALGSIYDYEVAKDYLQKAIDLASKTNNLRLKKSAMMYFFSYKIMNGNAKLALEYFNQNPLVGRVYANRGPKYLNWIIGETYLYCHQLDSAKIYFDKCIGEFKDDYDKNARLSVFDEYANVYLQLKQIPEAIELFKETNKLSIQTENLSSVINSSEKLKVLYEETGNYKEALYYANIHVTYKDSLEIMMKEREFASLEIENENKRLENEKLKTLEQEQHRHNIQYLAIIIAITFIFLLLMISGMMTISSRAIEILGFFSFIFFFEFIIMIADHKIIAITNGEPLKIWLIKIALISLLMPFHHYIEEELIHYLTSKKIIRMKERFKWKNIINWRPKHHAKHHKHVVQIKEQEPSKTE